MNWFLSRELDKSKTVYFTDYTRVFLNSDLSSQQVAILREFDEDYTPDTRNANKTMICEYKFERSLIQLSIHFTRCNVFIPTKFQQLFKRKMIRPLIRYMTSAIRSVCNVDTANELCFSINFYVEKNTIADSYSWWNECIRNIFHLKDYNKNTVFGDALPFECRRITIEMKFDDNFCLMFHNKNNDILF